MRMPPPAARPARAFTLLELMVVLSIIAILASIAMPSMLARVVRAQVAQGRALTPFVRQAVQTIYAAGVGMPADNAAAGVPPADHIVSPVVTNVRVEAGAITLTFGNQANRAIAGRRLTLRPAVVDGYPQVPIAWICGSAPVPGNMAVHTNDATDLPAQYLPPDCAAPLRH